MFILERVISEFNACTALSRCRYIVLFIDSDLFQYYIFKVYGNRVFTTAAQTFSLVFRIHDNFSRSLEIDFRAAVFFDVEQQSLRIAHIRSFKYERAFKTVKSYKLRKESVCLVRTGIRSVARLECSVCGSGQVFINKCYISCKGDFRAFLRNFGVAVIVRIRVAGICDVFVVTCVCDVFVASICDVFVIASICDVFVITRVCDVFVIA